MDEDRERVVEPDAGVMSGEDDFPREPAPPLDPYTPEPSARPGERRAWRLMRLAWIPILVALAILLYVLLS